MIRKMLPYLMFPLLLLPDAGRGGSPTQLPKTLDGINGTRERLIASNGRVTINLDLNRLNGRIFGNQESKLENFRFEVGSGSFFGIRLANDILRGADPGTLGLIWRGPGVLPAQLSSSADQLVVERLAPSEAFELQIRDGKTGFVYFNIEGHTYDYDAATHSLSIKGGRLLISEDLANKLGRPADAGLVVGQISISANMIPVEITTVVNGAIQSTILPAHSRTPNDPTGSVPGPDIVVGNMNSLAQYGSSNGQVGLGIGTTSCNNGDQPVHFYELPDPDHSVVSQNLYRMSGGAGNSDRFEQVGQAWVKHTFGASQDDECSFGCTPFPNDTELGVGCSDTYASSQNASQTDHVGALGSRAWVNPFTGAFSVNPRPENHAGHVHTGTSHRILVNVSDLNTTTNTGAAYYAEVQYDSPHEYAWCQAHAGQCNMYNNASYRRYSVSGTTSFTFTAIGSTVRMTPATAAWTGATSVTVEPEPGVDGRAFVVYKITNPSAGVWHYEYAIHNQNLDRSIQSFSVPLGAGASISNIGFHAPPNHPGFPNDGTFNNAGFSNTPWTSGQTATDVTWNCETLAQNQNANAIRFGTLYNFRFDSDQPPQTINATVGFYKTGSPITVAIQGPAPFGSATPTPTPESSVTPTPGITPTPGVTPTPAPTVTPGGSVTPTPGETPTPTASPTGTAQALNLSTRLNVGTGNNVGIGGFIVTGTSPVSVLVRGIGPSLTGTGVTVLADPMLELHGPNGFVTMMNNNWRETQETQIMATGIAPANDLESAILATLDPGPYTALLSGNNNGSGVGLVEVYDLTHGGPSKLGNISTRAFVGTGSDIVIAGFILGNGTENDPVIVRGIGPSLSGTGVTPLADPFLELRDSSGTLLASNDNWMSDPNQLPPIVSSGLAPSSPLESVIATTLAPGSYTALLSGVSNGTGIGLVEVYDHPASVPTPTPGGGTPTPTASPGGDTPTPTPPSPTPTEHPPTPTPTDHTPTPTPTPGTCVENFDGVTAPALPSGWEASNPVPGDGVMFVTSTTSPDSAPNDAFVPDQNGISDKVLDRMNVTVQSGSAVLTFRNNFDSEVSGGVFWDGGVLEVSTPNISNGDFLDITDPHVGGTITSGGYTGEISGDASNPLAGRMAWSGSSGGYIDTTITLGQNLAGQLVTFRWRFGSDEAVAAPGWRIDNLSITGATCP